MASIRRRLVEKLGVERRLQALSPVQQVAFAAACAGRSVERIDEWAAGRDSSRSAPYHAAVDGLWEFVEGRTTQFRLRQLLREADAAFPDPNVDDVTNGADAAALAVLFALEGAAKNDGELLRRAAEQAYSSLWAPITRGDGEPVTLDVLDERELASPILQHEINIHVAALDRAESFSNPKRVDFADLLA